MTTRLTLAAALAAAWAVSPAVRAADDPKLAQIRAEIEQLKSSYESRIAALERRLQAAESRGDSPQAVQPASAPTPTVAALAGTAPPAPPATAAPVQSSASAFNPEIALIVGGHYANLSQDPTKYRIQGFIPGGDEIGPGKRSFNLGESELALAANIDPHFLGRVMLAITPDNTISVEEAYVATRGLDHGLTAKGGRFLSGIGYLNAQHAHTWDFVDAPLAYQAMLGGQYRADGVQLKWLAPTDRLVELGAELGNGGAFPGNERNKNGAGAAAVFAHIGDDIGDSASWRAGLSYLQTSATDRTYTDTDRSGTGVTNAFSGNSKLWLIDGIYKWAPDGNATRTSLKLQGEYFFRKEDGTLTYDTQAQSFGTTALAYASAQSGGYLQGVYQFMPGWRAGLRFDLLNAGTPTIGANASGLSADDFSRLAAYRPRRTSLMMDYSPTEFSRIRLQLAEDKTRPEAADRQIFLQYIMSLGAHGAHTF